MTAEGDCMLWPERHKSPVSARAYPRRATSVGLECTVFRRLAFIAPVYFTGNVTGYDVMKQKLQICVKRFF